MARKRAEDEPGLTPAEGEIMEIIWDHVEVSASQVRAILGRTRPVARPTVRTLLERMEAKAWIKHREEGRSFLYSAARPRQATIGQRVREIVETICGGSPEALVTALLDYRGLDAGELERIRGLLAAARAVPTDDKQGGV